MRDGSTAVSPDLRIYGPAASARRREIAVSSAACIDVKLEDLFEDLAAVREPVGQVFEQANRYLLAIELLPLDAVLDVANLDVHWVAPLQRPQCLERDVAEMTSGSRVKEKLKLVHHDGQPSRRWSACWRHCSGR